MRSMLCRFGHVASYRELLEQAHGQESTVAPLRARYRNATTIHLRQDVYVCAHLDDDELTAARVGGWLDCVTVLARYGLPVGDAPQRHLDGARGTRSERRADCLHLRLRRNDGRASERRNGESREIRAHWTPPSWPVLTAQQTLQRAHRPHRGLTRLEVPLPEALRQALTSCLTVDESLAAITAGFGLLGTDVLAQVIARTPAHARTRLRRAGLPRPVDLALDALSSGNQFDEL